MGYTGKRKPASQREQLTEAVYSIRTIFVRSSSDELAVATNIQRKRMRRVFLQYVGAYHRHAYHFVDSNVAWHFHPSAGC